MARAMSTVLYFCLIAAVIVQSQHPPSSGRNFDIHPANVTMVVNSSVDLLCKVGSFAHDVQWTKDHFGLGFKAELKREPTSRFWLSGNQSKGEFNLHFDRLTLRDEGAYRCTVKNHHAEYDPMISNASNVHILVPPQQPRILQGDIVYATENITLTLECVTEGAKPAALLTWNNYDGSPIVEGIKEYVEAMENNRKLFRTRSVLSIVPDLDFHTKYITCGAFNPALEYKLKTKTMVNVKYSPKSNTILHN